MVLRGRILSDKFLTAKRKFWFSRMFIWQQSLKRYWLPWVSVHWFVVCSLFINTNCSNKAGLQVQRNTLINNTMYITKRYKIFEPILVLTITLCWSWCLRLYFDSLLTNKPSHMGGSGLPDLTLFIKLTYDSALRASNNHNRLWVISSIGETQTREENTSESRATGIFLPHFYFSSKLETTCRL